MRRRTKYALCIGVTGLVAVLLMTATVSRRQAVGFTFLGFRAESGGAMSAMFEVRNLTEKPLISVGMLPSQLYSDGRWRWSQQPVARINTILFTNVPWTVGFPAPNHFAVWRAAMISRSEASDRMQERINRFLFRYPRLRTTRELFGTFSFSKPIPPPIEPYLHYEAPQTRPDPPSPWE